MAVDMGGKEVELYCNTGSNITIITPDIYRKGMGKLVAARSHLRAWGSDKYLDTKGIFKTTLTNSSGATKETWAYVVAGVRPTAYSTAYSTYSTSPSRRRRPRGASG